MQNLKHIPKENIIIYHKNSENQDHGEITLKRNKLAREQAISAASSFHVM